MQIAVGYSSVSTRERGRSGFGLVADRYDIEAFGAHGEFSIKSWYQDVQTGARKDALAPASPGLAAALKDARVSRCPLPSRLELG